MANTTKNRFNSAKNQDSTYRVISFAANTITWSGSTASIITDSTKAETVAQLGVLAAGTIDVKAVGLTATGTSPMINDRLRLWATGPGIGTTSSMILDSNFKQQTSNTNTISANKIFKAEFVYDGTYWIGSGFSI